ncbi:MULTISPECIES: hypothetical protein [unclassified Oceanispirochaeta]|uniref:hypothetical protein n=1 Tax=unclassified Oceanispirochaeta TaxID=2635722 RepID=UPI000E08ED32|nr:MULTISPECIES: hypothetical protein [unclassified Oceanispirochaeta]MBF9018477.1 hypothetical protein [Oceanispirochaeta sp. M2]NPD74883.1 hypothetical protein [Oceanispirochaeta sp. M1]RDG29270.1 hypothetical protein DV872_22560 [Oceanispirochaeta sp. M1]
MRSRGGSALYFSLAEFVWILFFLAAGALTLGYKEYKSMESEHSALKENHASLSANYLIVKARLDELENGVVPCWKRPDSPIPPVIGEIIIESPRLIRISSYKGKDQSLVISSGESEGSQQAAFNTLRQMLRSRYKEEFDTAGDENCYLRMRILNQTERYSLYQQSAAVLKSLGIVVVQED